MTIYTIKRDGKYVRDYTDGAKLTSNYNMAEKYTDKKSAIEAAREYGRRNGKGYTVKEF